EEAYYQTDPVDPDTDGDGYLDGEEVASGYDPVVPAPNDALPGTDTNAPRPIPKNLTTYLTQLLAQKVSSGEFEPSLAENLAEGTNDPNLPYNQDVMNEALYQIGLRAKEYFALPQIDEKEIRVSSEQTSYESVGQYINVMSQAVSADETIMRLGKNEATIIQEAVESSNMDSVQLLIASTHSSVEWVKNITVPQGFEDLHRRQLALLILQENIFKAIKNISDDPIMAAAGMETYGSIVDLYQKFSEELELKIQSYQ
ncbi:MAG: thrombospondin type 3 repeat-containing protein, partial [Patescibacteria group bacterium]